MSRAIADYITAQRGRYTREAITKQLVEAGHDPAEIERTWATLDAHDPDATAGSGFWGRFALIVVGINLAVLLLVAITTGILANVVAGGSTATFLIVVLAIALVVGALIAWGIVALTEPTKLGRRTAYAIGTTIPLVAALLVGGACYAMVGATGGLDAPPVQGTLVLQIDEPMRFGGEATGTCTLYEGGGVSVWATDIFSPDGGFITVSVDVAPGPTDGPVTATHLRISFEGDDQARYYTTEHMESFWDATIGEGGRSGTIVFTSLPPDPNYGPVTDPAPLVGEVRWTCDATGRGK